jgi:FMN phosphatase YigB (HAD superfamily)
MTSTPITTVFFDLGDTLVRSPTTWIPGAKDALSILQGMQLRLGIISNTGQLTRTQILQQLPPDFDLGIFEPNLVLFSSEVGVEKPAAAIFRMAVQRAAGSASQCLFCTENLTDSLAAQSVGMIAARIQKPPASDISALIMAAQTVGLLS